MSKIETGLSDKEVLDSRMLYGSNILTHKKKNTFLSLLIESLNDPIIKILLIALVIKIVFLFKDSNIYETIGIVVAIFLSSSISTISEYGSEKAFEKLESESSKIKCKVKRNSKLESINIEEIVVNDIVHLSSGDKVPADGILIKGNISVDESSLTGETKEKNKKINDILYKGSIVINNSGVIRITNVGDKTFYGGIASEIQEYAPESPLKLRLRGLAKIISRIGYIGSFLTFFSYLINVIIIKNNFDLNKIINFISNPSIIMPHILYALTMAVTIIVVAVPEGLPMMITLVLSSNMKRMLKSNVLVRKLVGIETAGSLNILFTDKTGTLTEGKLKCIGYMNYDKSFYENIDNIYNKTIKELINISLYYNNESIIEGSNVIGGNSTDRAVIEYVKDYNNIYEVINKEHFDSKIKYSSVVTSYDKNKTFIKGAYEILIDKCKYYYDSDNNKKILNSKKELLNRIDEDAKKGIRILALVIKENYEYILLGFMYLKDIVRKEAIEGIKLVKNAGIETVMITGDSLYTAKGIAEELNMLDEGSIILTSEELNNMSDDEVKNIIPKLRVLARSLPKDKSRLVTLSQELGLTVGMTGDGVNDAPALKKSNVGFAMGSGTEVAKEVSDIIILDDNFLSISNAILFGRTVFKSIRKFIIFQLTVNFCAVSLSIIGPYFGILSPITVVQMLWVNMVMDTLAALAFSYEAPLKEYMEEIPKKKDEPIINKHMLIQILFDSLYCTILCLLFLKSNIITNLFRIGNNNKYLMTAFFSLFIFLAIFNLFNARTTRINILANILKNKVFIFIILLISVVQIILIYFGGEIFRTTGLTFIEFNIVIFLSFTVIPIDIIRKIILKLKGIKTII